MDVIGTYFTKPVMYSSSGTPASTWIGHIRYMKKAAVERHTYYNGPKNLDSESG